MERYKMEIYSITFNSLILGSSHKNNTTWFSQDNLDNNYPTIRSKLQEAQANPLLSKNPFWFVNNLSKWSKCPIETKS